MLSRRRQRSRPRRRVHEPSRASGGVERIRSARRTGHQFPIACLNRPASCTVPPSSIEVTDCHSIRAVPPRVSHGARAGPLFATRPPAEVGVGVCISVGGGSPTAARVYAHLRDFFGWCTREHILTANPMTNMLAPATSGSATGIGDDELRAIWLAADQLDPQEGSYVKVDDATCGAQG